MNRTHLEHAVEALALEHGCAFFAARDDCLPQAVTIYPAVVLAPLALHSAEGRDHGRITYDMTLRMLCLGARLSQAERCNAHAGLETALLALFSGLSEDERVLSVEALEIRPAAFTLTPHGELSQTATARIITWF